MKLYAPKYCENFKCIAEKCRHSCCVGWQISVDADTFSWHKGSQHPISRELVSSLCEADDGEYIGLCDDGRCPFLDASGLCRIHSELGEERTSRICREHPRFYHRVGKRYEMGLGAVCEEAVRLIFESDSPFDMMEIERDFCGEIEEMDYDTISERDKMLCIVNSSGNYRDAISLLLSEYDIEDSIFTSSELADAFLDLELLDEAHREMLCKCAPKAPKCKDIFTKRFLLYLIFRHVSLSRNYEDLRSNVAFSITLSNILATAQDSQVYERARIISEEIEYSEDNTAAIKFALFCLI